MLATNMPQIQNSNLEIRITDTKSLTYWEHYFTGGSCGGKSLYALCIIILFSVLQRSWRCGLSKRKEKHNYYIEIDRVTVIYR